MPGKTKLSALAEKHLGSEVISARGIWKLFLPILFDTVTINVLMMISSSMVSIAGEEAVAAVNMVDSINYFFTNFYVAIATGGTVVVAQYFGHKDPRNAGRATSQAFLSAVGLAALIALFMIVFSDLVIGFLFGDAEPLVLEYGRTYLICCAVSYPFYAAYQACMGALRGSGDTRASMVFSITLNGLFFVFSFLMINVLKLGVLGSGLAMISCRVLIVLILMTYLLRKRRDLQLSFRSFVTFDLSLQKSILYVGFPTALEQVFFHGGKIITQTFIVSLGTAHMTANAVAGNLFNVIMAPANAVCTLVVTVVGFCMGAGKPEEGKRLLRNLIIVSTVLQTLFGFICYPLMPAVIGLFRVSADITFRTMRCILILVISMPLWCPAFVTPSGLRAAGDAKFTSLVALTVMWLVRVLLGYLFAITLSMGIEGIWLAMCTEWIFRDVIFLWRMHGTKWYRHKLINT